MVSTGCSNGISKKKNIRVTYFFGSLYIQNERYNVGLSLYFVHSRVFVQHFVVYLYFLFSQSL